MNRKWPLYIFEAVMLAFLVLFLYPFVIVFINSAKDSFSITQYPMKLPEHWGQIFVNMGAILTNTNIRYGSSFISSILITALSLLAVPLLPAQAGWALVRTKTRVSQGIFFLFVARNNFV